MKLTFERKALLTHLEKALKKAKDALVRENKDAESKHERYIAEEIKKLEKALADAKAGRPFATVSRYDNASKRREPQKSSKEIDNLERLIEIVGMTTNDVFALDGGDKLGLVDVLKSLK